MGCDHEAVVTFPSGVVSGPYDLTLTFQGMPSISARCSDPTAPETADNPEGVACDQSGFTLTGPDAANRTVVVTLSDAASGDALIEAVEVRLDAVDELRPNGPSCPPTCFVRNGQLNATAPQ